MTEMDFSPLLSLPPELLHKSLAFADPLDVSSFARTCRTATAFVNSDPSLFKELFLILFDPPFELTDDFHPVENYNYVVELKRRIAARGVVRSTNEQYRNEALVDTVTTFISIASNPTPPPSSTTSTAAPSRNLQFLNLLSSNGETRLFLHQNFSADDKEEFISLASLHRDQVTSHLHVLHTPSAMVLDSTSARTAAREVVYDRRNFLKRSNYGPFSNDGTGRVDWIKLEGLSLVMSQNLRESMTLGWDNDGKVTVPLAGWEDTRPGSAALSKVVVGQGEDEAGKEKEKVVDRDWAGVESTEWRGTYSFLDYRVWDEFNFRRQRGHRVSLENEGEAVGDCMSLILKLVDTPVEDTIMIPPLDESVQGTGGNGTGDGEGVRTRAASLRSAVLGREEDEDDDEEDGDFPSPVSDSTDGSDGGLTADTDYVAPPAPSSRTTPLAVVDVASTPRTNAFFAPPPTIMRPPTAPTTATPPLYFTGSFSNTFAASQMLDRSIRGSVRLNFEGAVCWNFTIRYGGEDQWDMSGVQVGGIKSRFGILGAWSSSEHDVGSPCGPFFYWPHLD